MTEQELKDEKEQAVKRGGEIYADHYIEGLLDGRNLALRQFAVSFSLWEYGTCNGSYARRHKVNKNVQFIIFKKGDQKYVNGIGHTHDKWVDFDSSWWDNFTPTN